MHGEMVHRYSGMVQSANNGRDDPFPLGNVQRDPAPFTIDGYLPERNVLQTLNHSVMCPNPLKGGNKVPSSVFRQAVKEATGITWEDWVSKLKQTVEASWSFEQIKEHLCEAYHVSDEWGERLAVMYGQLLGRVPVGVTKDAGVQIGIRRTVAIKKEKMWNFLTSPQGIFIWIGNVPGFRLEKGYEFQSAEGITRKMRTINRIRI